LPSASTSANVSLRGQGSRTGDLHPLSSRPCRAYTKQSSRLVTLAADFDVRLFHAAIRIHIVAFCYFHDKM
jgi:hypothetical protein